MKLENISITGTIDGQPYIVILTDDQKKLLPSLIASCDPSGQCRVAKLPKDYTIQKIDLSNNED